MFKKLSIHITTITKNVHRSNYSILNDTKCYELYKKINTTALTPFSHNKLVTGYTYVFKILFKSLQFNWNLVHEVHIQKHSTIHLDMNDTFIRIDVSYIKTFKIILRCVQERLWILLENYNKVFAKYISVNTDFKIIPSCLAD